MLGGTSNSVLLHASVIICAISLSLSLSRESSFAEFIKKKHALSNTTIDSKRGVMMCAANKMVPDVMKMIWTLRRIWHSNLGFAVSHCGEITEQNIIMLQEFEPTIHVINICKQYPVYGMESAEANWRLRGFFCKVGAVIDSPFEETLVVDLDVSSHQYLLLI